MIVELARTMAEGEPISTGGVMEHAVMTHHKAITSDARRRLQLLIGKYLG